MIAPEIFQIYNILVSFLGPSKRELDETYQLQFACPRCIEREGEKERRKFNLEVSLKRNVFKCWSCSSFDDEMHGSVGKLIKIYGNKELFSDYKRLIKEFRESSLYKLNFQDDDFKIVEEEEIESLNLPVGTRKLIRGVNNPQEVIKYLKERNIGWKIVEEFNIGYTLDNTEKKALSYRIILPSFDKYGEINYWTGRDYKNRKWVEKYFNPRANRKELIFNEEKVNWDSDITLVEGPFDHIVVPNSIPLLGKKIDTDYKVYQDIMNKCNAHVNVFLDGDALFDVMKIYQKLNHGRMYGKIRFIPVPNDNRDLDPAKIYQLYGRKGILQFLASSRIFNETELAVATSKI